MSRELLRPWLERAAERLTGRYVAVKLEPPPAPWDHALGLSFKSNGRGVVMVDPELDDDTFLNVFCHELAHVRLHWRTMGDIGAAGRGRLPAPAPPSRGDVREENEADGRAARWAEQATKAGGPGLWRQVFALAYLPLED